MNDAVDGLWISRALFMSMKIGPEGLSRPNRDQEYPRAWQKIVYSFIRVGSGRFRKLQMAVRIPSSSLIQIS